MRPNAPELRVFGVVVVVKVCQLDGGAAVPLVIHTFDTLLSLDGVV